MLNKECPYCGDRMKIQTFKEDGHIVEIDKRCDCGFHYSWAYGREEVELPDDYKEAVKIRDFNVRQLNNSTTGDV